MNEKQEVYQVLNEKELAPTTQEQTHAPTEGKTSKKLEKYHPIAPPCRHEIEGNPEPTDNEQATESKPESKKNRFPSLREIEMRRGRKNF